MNLKSKIIVMLKAAFLLLPIICFSSCDDLDKLIKPDKTTVNLTTDGKRTLVVRKNTIRIVDNGVGLFDLKYTEDGRLEVLNGTVNQQYTVEMAALGFIENIEDVSIPSFPTWKTQTDLLVQNGILLRYKEIKDGKVMYFIIYPPAQKYNSTSITIQCQRLNSPELKYSSPQTIRMSKGSTSYITRDGIMNLLELENDYPNFRVFTNSTGIKEAPQITYSGKYNSETEEFPELQGGWADEAPIMEDGVYYIKVGYYGGGYFLARCRVTEVTIDGEITLIYQTARVTIPELLF